MDFDFQGTLNRNNNVMLDAKPVIRGRDRNHDGALYSNC